MTRSLRVDEYPGFHFAHMKVEMPVKHLSGDATLAAACVSLELRFLKSSYIFGSFQHMVGI